ncbi:MAG: hypothetical protein A2X94_17595 [Bdellovibrionales bacterium GWB1_55_8]|nr:MAG: hypothetical protein A2X94_17595 [Bdellovibrionales bacterium GWB1_55_8]
MPPVKLPKDVVSDPRHDAVIDALSRKTTRLWTNGGNEVTDLMMSPGLRTELQRALDLRHASQGLEQIAQQLMREQKGLDALGEKGPQSPRISRLLFVANDGSERFYRECDSLLTRYRQRLLGFRIDMPGEELGTQLFGGPKLVRAILVFDKKAAAQVLLSLA